MGNKGKKPNAADLKKGVKDTLQWMMDTHEELRDLIREGLVLMNGESDAWWNAKRNYTVFQWTGLALRRVGRNDLAEIFENKDGRIGELLAKALQELSFINFAAEDMAAADSRQFQALQRLGRGCLIRS